MAIIVKAPETKYTPAPEGVWQGVCCDVIEHTDVETPWGLKDMVEVRWQLEELDDANVDREGNPRPYMVTRRYTASLDRRSNLRRDLESWRNKKFNGEELAGFDVEVLIGVNCQVQVQHHLAENGNTYANVVAVLPAPKNQPKLRVSESYVRVKDREPSESLEAKVKKAVDDDEIPF